MKKLTIKRSTRLHTQFAAGYSLLELMVVLTIFALIAIITTQTLLVTLRGARKSDISSNVRSNIEFALATMERHLRNADSFVCPNSDPQIIEYIDQNNTLTDFSCRNIGSNGFVASSEARLTSDEINVSSCEFVCEVGDLSAPPSVTINLEAKEAQAQGSEQTTITTSTRIYTRSY